MTQSTDPENDEPIDVEFTEAQSVSEPETAGGSGPGWIGLISAAVIAALAGGAIGVVASGAGGRYAQAEIAVDVSKLQESDKNFQDELSVLRESLRDMGVRLSKVIETEEARDAETVERIQLITDELERVKIAYMQVIGVSPLADTADGDPIASDAESDEIASEAGDDLPNSNLPAPELSLTRIVERLDAMETIKADDTGATSSRQVARSVAALQERTQQLEAVDLEFRETFAARLAIIEGLKSEFDLLDESLNTLRVDVAQNSSKLGEGQLASAQTLNDLQAEIDAMRGVVNDKLTAIEGAKLSVNEEALIRKADRVLALSTLETAIRTGLSFEQELEALAIQLPANGRVSALRRFAGEGALTVDQLMTKLDDLKESATNAGMPDKPKGQWAWVGDILENVVTVREEGTAEGQTASQRIDTALSLLDAGDLPGAITEIKTIDGEQGAVLTDWVVLAERRVRANSLLERLRNDVLNLEDVE